MEISALERKIKSRTILLFIHAVYGIYTLFRLSLPNIRFFSWTEKTFMISFALLYIGLIIAGVLIIKLNKTGFILALVLVAISWIIPNINRIIMHLNQIPFDVFGLVFDSIIIALYIWLMVSGLRKLSQLNNLKVELQDLLSEARMRAEEEAQPAFVQPQETQFPQ
jgi:hypothetical protein